MWGAEENGDPNVNRGGNGSAGVEQFAGVLASLVSDASPSRRKPDNEEGIGTANGGMLCMRIEERFC